MTAAAPALGPSRLAARRVLLWALLPALAVLLLRALLQAQTDAATAALQPLRGATQVATPGEALWAAARPFVAALAGLGSAIGLTLWAWRAALRRQATAHFARAAALLWLLLALSTAAWLLADHLNRVGRQRLPEQGARVLLARELAPSARGEGGVELYLQLAGEAAPARLLVPGARPGAYPPGHALTLRPEAGRWWGRWAAVAGGGAGG